MSDDRVFDALRQLLLAAPVIRKNVFIVGGTALWDWWYAIIPSVRHSGGDLEEPRFTKDIDLGVERKTVQVAGHPEALRKALEDNGWRQQQEGSFIWENPAWGEITVELLVYTDVGDNPGSPIRIRIRNSSNVKNREGVRNAEAAGPDARSSGAMSVSRDRRIPSLPVYSTRPFVVEGHRNRQRPRRVPRGEARESRP